MFGLCDHQGCKHASACRPVVLVRSKDSPEQQAAPDRFLRVVAGLDCYEVQYEVQMEFCSAHQDSFRKGFLLSEGMWSVIENQLRGNQFAPPDKDSVEIRWVPAAGPDGLDDVGRHAVAVAHGRELGTHPLSIIKDRSVDQLKAAASQGIYPRGM